MKLKIATCIAMAVVVMDYSAAAAQTGPSHQTGPRQLTGAPQARNADTAQPQMRMATDPPQWVSAQAPRKNPLRFQLAGLNVAAWLPPSTSTPSPLVIFSHGYHGCNTQSTFLMAAISQSGYIVIAPNHSDATCGQPTAVEPPYVSFGDPAAWDESTYRNRAIDVVNLVQALHADAGWNRSIDWSRVALAGHSLGGYTVLGLAGAWSGWKITGIRAVLALSPYTEPFLTHGYLGNMDVPVMYQGGTLDMGITPSVKKPGGAYDQTQPAAYFVEFDGAGHLAWTDAKAQSHESIVYYSVAFLNKYLKGDDQGALTVKLADVTILQGK